MNFHNDESGETAAEQGGMNNQQHQKSGDSQTAQQSPVASQPDVETVAQKAEMTKRYAIEEIEALREEVSELREENRALALAVTEVDAGLAEAFDRIRTKKINWKEDAQSIDSFPDVETDSEE